MFRRWLRFFTDFPKDRLKEKIRKVVFLLSICVLIISGSVLISYYVRMNNVQNKLDMISEVMQNASSATSEETQEIRKEEEIPPEVPNKFVKLYAMNPDIVGWLNIATENDPKYVDWPVVQAKDNDYYLRRDFDRKYSIMGTPFLDYRNDAVHLSRNNIIYGHSAQSTNQLFTKLHKYKTLSFLQKNPLIRYDTLERDIQWVIYSVYITNTLPEHGVPFYYIRTDFTDDADFENFLGETVRRSDFITNVDVTADDNILTLSTCTYEYGLKGLRLVIHARQVREGESMDQFQASANPNPVSFDALEKKRGIKK